MVSKKKCKSADSNPPKTPTADGVLCGMWAFQNHPSVR